MKWNAKRGWRTSQRLMAGVLWVETLSDTMCTSRCSGTWVSMRFKNLRNSSARWRAVMEVITLPEAASSAANRLVGAAAAVAVGAALGRAGHQRQDRGGSVQCLDLGLLVDADHDRGLRRVEVQAHDVSGLVDELRVRRHLELLDDVRLDPERPPDLRDRGLRYPHRLSHGPRRPVRRVRWGLLDVRDRARQAAHESVWASQMGGLAFLRSAADSSKRLLEELAVLLSSERERCLHFGRMSPFIPNVFPRACRPSVEQAATPETDRTQSRSTVVQSTSDGNAGTVGTGTINPPREWEYSSPSSSMASWQSEQNSSRMEHMTNIRCWSLCCLAWR